MTTETQTLDDLCINTIRMFSIDAVQQANSGHPGMPMGAAAMAYVLWTRFLKHNPADPHWPDRDRFILSAGHGSMLLYSLLHLTGYDLPLEQIKRFRQWGSATPGHPERNHTPGVEVTTGPLGQGFGNGVGMAMAERWLAARFNRPGHEIVSHYTYAIVSDGDLMEGIAAEAAALAGHLRLGKLIYLYDDNRISLAGTTNLSFSEDVAMRFAAYGWHTLDVADGNDLDAIDHAITAAQAETERPSLILVHTQIGYGSPKKAGTFGAHGSPLGTDEVRATKEQLGWPTDQPFFLPDEAVQHFRQALATGAQAQGTWQERVESYAQDYPAEADELRRMLAGELPPGWHSGLPQWSPGDKPIATRSAGGQVLNALAGAIPNLIGGSADLNPSTNTAIKNGGDFQSPTLQADGVQGATGGGWGYSGRNIHFGVREHAMGAAVNGMAAHGGVRPYSATFLIFSDYMKPAMRLGALMHLPAIYIFTHDSIAVGEDGPTHEPIEQLAGLRAIPNLVVIRPADANETAEAWAAALEQNGPTVLALSRQNLPILDRSAAVDGHVARGAYILRDDASPEVILIGSGSEVALCLEARERLAQYGVGARVVSMPSWELFEAQESAYRESVLPAAMRKRVTVEAGATQGWERYAGSEGVCIGITSFGASAPGEEVMQRFGFTAQRVAAAALRLLGKLAEAAREEVENQVGGDTAVAPTAPQEGHS
ncbi:MAG: transketolase [Chloroflexaceae bacterium]|jgi:transketolase|nr:transketolase [Chloroflexaceae bacterium]